jgi:hypothetical protein
MLHVFTRCCAEHDDLSVAEWKIAGQHDTYLVSLRNSNARSVLSHGASEVAAFPTRVHVMSASVDAVEEARTAATG